MLLPFEHTLEQPVRIHLCKLHFVLLKAGKQENFPCKATLAIRHEQVQRCSLRQSTRNFGPRIPPNFEHFSCSTVPPFCSDFQLKNKWL